MPSFNQIRKLAVPTQSLVKGQSEFATHNGTLFIFSQRGGVNETFPTMATINHTDSHI